MTAKSIAFKQKAIDLDYELCLAANGLLRHDIVHQGFNIVSRLGDGVFWYALILSLPLLAPENGLLLAVFMTLIGLLNVYVYKRIKKSLARPRPFMVYPTIQKGTRVLDEYSFPSGHTLHAVTFSLILTVYNPLLGSILVPFALATGMSRVVLGVHFPSDVLVGALIGVVHGAFAVMLLSWLNLI